MDVSPLSAPNEPSLSRDLQNQLCRLVARVAQTLMQHGAETKLIEETSIRLGTCLGLEQVDMAITANAIVITGRVSGRCVTTTRRVYDRGLNMQMVCEVQRLTIMAEKHLLDAAQVEQRLNNLVPLKYPRWVIVVMVGLSCASFAAQFGGSLPVCLNTFVASSCAMAFRQSMGKRHHSPMVNFCLTAFVATMIAGVATTFHLGRHPEIAQAASVLLLIPGFPLINAVSDLVKGHINMGIARWFFASLLTLSAAVGVSFAMWLGHLWGLW
ncbi:threonine/serine exporter family protein [Aliagarivorans marinus]|uniref:threonine/serine exporter family protein n=1 Tax=Aliagarivorans marinus TaxID=561965 RepID=UPI0003F5B3C8|nr:threonine/serine exporter family protein [Aliagarivorans marinus]